LIRCRNVVCSGFAAAGTDANTVSGDIVILYEVIGLPPLVAGGDQLISTDEFPGFAVTLIGAPGRFAPLEGRGGCVGAGGAGIEPAEIVLG